MSDPRHLLLRLSAIALVAASLGAGPPEVRRVLVPPDRVGAVFPAGSELVGLSIPEFDDLMRRVDQARDDPDRADQPILLRARHQARWDEAGLLRGESLLVIQPASKPAPLGLAPWSPAIAAGAEDHPTVRTAPDGTTAIWVPAGTRPLTMRLEWTQAAESTSRMPWLALALPRLASAILELDLPASFQPPPLPGMVRTLSPAPSDGRRVWTYTGPIGEQALELPLRDRVSAQGEPVWVHGQTSIEVKGPVADLTLIWDVTHNGEPLAIAVDPGVELLSVEGATPQFDTTAPAPALDRPTRVELNWSPSLTQEVQVTLRARTLVPLEGSWTIPSIRPIDCLWTGGTTGVTIGPDRILETVRPLAGVAVNRAADPEEPPGAQPGMVRLAFWAVGPGPPAELQFQRPDPRCSVAIEGQILLEPTAIRLVAAVTWKVEQGLVASPRVDLPAGWQPAAVQVEGRSEAVSWQVEPRPAGGSRLHIPLPAGSTAANSSLRVLITAVRSQASSRDRLDLPRLSAVDCLLEDDRWVLWASPDEVISPTTASGLAWIDPGQITLDPPATLTQPLAWRWLRDDATLRLTRSRREQRVSAEVAQFTSISGDVLTLTTRIRIELGDRSLRILPILLDIPADASLEWRLGEETTSAPLPVRARPPRGRAAPSDGSDEQAWMLDLNYPRRGSLVVWSRWQTNWQGRGSIPLIGLPRFLDTRGTILVAVDRTMQSSATVKGLRLLDPQVTLQGLQASETAPAGGGWIELASNQRLAHAYGFTTTGASAIEIETQRLGPLGASGLVSEAILQTPVSQGTPQSHQLRLQVVPLSAQSLRVGLPNDCQVQRITLDNQPIAPRESDRDLAIPLNPLGPLRSASEIRIDYITPGAASPNQLEAIRPRLSLPCLSFTWQVETLASVEVDEPRPSPLASREPQPRLAPWSSLLDRWLPTSRAPLLGLAAQHRAELVARSPVIERDGLTLADLLLLWDAGSIPVLVDRQALGVGGWGPRTRLVPSPEIAPLDRDSVPDWIETQGLRLLSLDGFVLLTTPRAMPHHAMARSELDAWARALQVASIRGQDSVQRVESITRWVTRTPTPSGLPGRADTVDQTRRASRDWWFTGDPLPLTPMTLSWWSRTSLHATVWGSALAVFALGLAGRRLDPRMRGLALGVLWALALALRQWGTLAIAQVGWGLTLGGLVCLCYWMGRTLAWPRRDAQGLRPAPSSTGSQRRRAAAAAAIFALIATLLTGAQQPDPEPQAHEPPVIALLVATDGKTPDYAWLLRSDHERLLAAVPSVPPTPAAAVWCEQATHELGPDSGGSRELRTRYELWSDQEEGEAASWSFPIGDERDLSATLDGQPAPIQILDEAHRGRVAVPGQGRHTLVVTRWVPVVRATGGWSLKAPLVPVAVSTLRWCDAPVAQAIWLEHLGPINEQPPGTFVAQLGPVPRLYLRASAPEPALSDLEAAPTAEGWMLWDAETAGDRVHVRLAWRGPRELERAELALGPGLLVRSARADVRISSQTQPAEAGAIWRADFEPALPEGSTLELELWRPLDPTTATADRDWPPRAWPIVEPLASASVVWNRAMRRPAGWAGELDPPPQNESLAPQAFVRGWGSALPAASASEMIHAARGSESPGGTLTLRPRTAQAALTPDVTLTIEPGLIRLQADLRMADQDGRVNELTLTIPPELQLVRVQAIGLTSWSRPDPGALRLRFDGNDPSPRLLRLEGWLPAESPPLEPIREHASPVPWIEAPEHVMQPGRLLVRGLPGGTVQLDDVVAAELVANPAPDPTAASPPPQLAYEVAGAGFSADLRWRDPDPRVQVTILSRLTCYPASTDWAAWMEYRTQSGPLEAITLSLPQPWADAVDVQANGLEEGLTRTVQDGLVTLNFRPSRSIWGAQRVWVRGSQPFQPEQGIAFPNLVPRGRGELVTYLVIANATGQTLSTQGSGAQPIVANRLPAPPEFEMPADLPLEVYSVQDPDWTLAVRGSSRPPAAGGLQPDSNATGAQHADLACTLAPDGTLTGRAAYELAPNPGAFFEVEMPAEARAIVAAVDGVPTQPLKGTDAFWFIPLGDEEATEVVLVWTDHQRPDPDQASDQLLLPVVPRQRVPTSVTLRLPPDVTQAMGTGSLRPTSPAVLELHRLERMAASIQQRILILDRSSTKQQTALLRSLIQFGARKRALQRQLAASPVQRAMGRDPLESLVQRLAQQSARIDESMEQAGLQPLLLAARARLGDLDKPTSTPEPVDVSEASSWLQIPRMGQLACFWDGPAPADPARSIVIRHETPTHILDRIWRERPTCLAVLVCLLVPVGCAQRAGQASRWLVLIAAVALIGTLGVLNPAVTALVIVAPLLLGLWLR